MRLSLCQASYMSGSFLYQIERTHCAILELAYDWQALETSGVGKKQVQGRYPGGISTHYFHPHHRSRSPEGHRKSSGHLQRTATSHYQTIHEATEFGNDSDIVMRYEGTYRNHLNYELPRPVTTLRSCPSRFHILVSVLLYEKV